MNGGSPVCRYPAARHSFVHPNTRMLVKVTLLGPVTAAFYTLPDVAQQPVVQPDSDEEKWQMLSLFTLPSHRGCGVAKTLCNAVLSWLRKTKTSLGKEHPAQIRVRIMVKPENTATIKLYEGLGSAHAGQRTLGEALIANGDAELIPEDGGGDAYQQRKGLIMAATIRRQ